MKRYVITISREFGSLGRPIAKALAGQLQIQYYDRDIVEYAAKVTNQPVSVVSEVEEKVNHLWRMKYPLGIGSTDLQDRIFQAQRRIMTDMASIRSCVVVGRCGDHVFREYTNRFRVFVYAPFEAKLKNCIEELDLDEKTARRMIREVDAARDAYHKIYAGTSIRSPGNYDLMIDSSYLGVEGTARVLASIVMQRFE